MLILKAYQSDMKVNQFDMKAYQLNVKKYHNSVTNLICAHINLVWKIPSGHVRKYQYGNIRNQNWYAKMPDWWPVLVLYFLCVVYPFTARVTSTCLVSFGPLVCTALSASRFNNMKCISLGNTYRLIKKKIDTAPLTRITLKPVYRPKYHILRSRVGGEFQSRFAAGISPFPFGPNSRVTCIW